MSNPVSNTEIEDVLSSIRRLVNEEARNIVAASQPQHEEKPTKLVLTQSLRVEEAVVDADADLADEPEAAESGEQLALVGESHEAEFTSQRTALVEDIEPAPETEPEHVSEDVAQQTEIIQGKHADKEDDLGDDFVFVREAKLKLRAEQRADLHEHAEEPTASDDAGEETAETAPESDSAPWKDPEATLYAAAQAGEDEAEDDQEPDEEDPEAPAATLKAVRSAPLGSKIEAFEAAIGETNDQWEPDGDVGDDYAGTQVETIQWEDHEEDHEEDNADEWREPEHPPELETEAEVVPEPVEDVPYEHEQDHGQDQGQDLTEDETDEEALDVLSSDENFLDEESLRELVADIVRQELQGALGERITRNVRKLVRREIHRALVAQDLE